MSSDSKNPTPQASADAQLLSGKSSISDIFINRPVMTVLLSIAAMFFGIFGYMKMPVNDLPGVDYPVIQVTVSYPGADPSIMAANVASPLEQQFMQIPGIEMITSRNSFGASSIVLQFSLSKNISAAATDVQSAIQRAMGNLPADLPSPPSFTQDNPNDMPIYILSVTSDAMPDRNLYDYAFSEIAQRIRMISGVSNVDIYAAPRAVRIKVDMPKLYNLGYTATDLKNALAVSTNMTGVGNLDGPTSQFVLLPDTQLSAAEDYDNIVVGFKDGSPIFFRDIAKAVDTIQYDTLNISFSLGNKKPEGRPIASIAMGIRKRSDGNAITTVADIKKLVEEFKTILPSSVKVSEMYDRSTLIIDNIDDVKETLIIAFLLVVFVIFLFLGRIRDTMIPTVALPFSILLTFIFMYAFGFSVNNLSLMGLTMAIGFLVDDAIVFLENTVRRMEDFGESPATATFRSAREISFTILSMTLSLAAVFIPLVFMSGITGRVFMEFSVTIITGGSHVGAGQPFADSNDVRAHIEGPNFRRRRHDRSREDVPQVGGRFPALLLPDAKVDAAPEFPDFPRRRGLRMGGMVFLRGATADNVSGGRQRIFAGRIHIRHQDFLA